MIGQLGSYSKYNSREAFGATASPSAPTAVQKKPEQKDEVKLSQSKPQIQQQPQRNFWDKNLSAILGITSLSFMGIMGLNFIASIISKRAANAAKIAKTESLLRKFVPDAASPKGFKDVIGMQDVKARLKVDYIDPITNPEIRKIYKDGYNMDRPPMPSGTLLIGDPGNGKTHIVKALAAELKADLYMLNMSDVGEIYIHGTGKNLAQALDAIKEKAKKSDKPILLFMDELDSIPKRSGIDVKSHEVEELNTILQNINDMQNHNIILIGATNRADLIDPAILRNGRFGNHIEVRHPDAAAREEFLTRMLGEAPDAKAFINDKHALGHVVEAMEGMSNSDIVGTIKIAISNAGAKGRQSLKAEHFLEVLENAPRKRVHRESIRQDNIGQDNLMPDSIEEYLDAWKEGLENFAKLFKGGAENAGGVVNESELERIVRLSATDTAEDIENAKLRADIEELTAPKGVSKSKKKSKAKKVQKAEPTNPVGKTEPEVKTSEPTATQDTPKSAESVVKSEPQPQAEPTTKEKLSLTMNNLKTMFDKGEMTKDQFNQEVDRILADFNRSNVK